MNTPNSYDARLYTLCAPWNGKRGDAYLRVFKPALLNGLLGINDDYDTLHAHALGTDTGGPNGPAHNGNAAEVRRSQNAYKARSAKLQSLIYKHVEDAGIRATIVDECAQVNAAINAGAALPFGAIAGTSAGMHALAILDRYGQQPVTGISESIRDSLWASLSLRQVGYNEESMLNLKLLINQTNAERPVPYAPATCRLKFLTLIDTPTALVDKATAEMQRCTYMDAGGNPDYDGTVAAFDELWRVYFQRGSIRPSTAQAVTTKGPMGNRVDGMALETGNNSDSSYDDDENCYTLTPDGERVLICWRCCGLGHTKRNCTSRRSYTINDCIQILQRASINKEAQKPINNTVRRAFYARRRGQPVNIYKRNINSKPQSFEALVDEEGNVFDGHNGELLGNVLGAPYPPGLGHDRGQEQLNARETQRSPSKDFVAEAVTAVTAVTATDFSPTLPATNSFTKVDRPLAWSADTFLACLENDGRDELADPADGEHRGKHVRGDALPFCPPEKSTSVPNLQALNLFNVNSNQLVGHLQRLSPVFLLLCLLSACIGACSLHPNAPATETTISFDTCNVYEVNLESASKKGLAHIDSGTTRHASGCIELFPKELIKVWQPNMHVRVANGMRLPVAFIGVMILPVVAYQESTKNGVLVRDKVIHYLHLHDALYVPAMPRTTTLVSTRQLFKEERISTYLNDALYLELPDGKRVEIHENETAYVLPFDLHKAMLMSAHAEYASNSAEEAVSNANMRTSPDLIHQRLCHFSFERIRASANCVRGLDLSQVQKPDDAKCDACVRGGGRKAASHTTEKRRYVRFGQRVCSDSCAMPKSTPFGFENMCPFVDLATGTIAVYFTRGHTNEEKRACFLQFEADFKENLTYNRGHVEEWHCDNHGEFSSRDMDTFLQELGVRQTFIVPWNPQQNPAERAHATILRPLRIMLAHANVSERLWPFGVAQIQVVHNSLASRSSHVICPGLSPYEMRTGKQPDLSIHRVMFCRMEALLRAPRDLLARGKLSTRTVTCVHLGWDSKRHGYFGYSPELHRLTTFRRQECFFFETEFPRVDFIVGSYLTEGSITPLKSEQQQEAEAAAYRRALANERASVFRSSNPEIVSPDNEAEEPDNMPSEVTERSEGPPSRRTRSTGYTPDSTGLAVWNDDSLTPLIKLGNDTLCYNSFAVDSDVPSTYYESQLGADAEEWREALNLHMVGKMANKTCTFVPRPKDAKVVKSKLVLTKKYNSDNTLAERCVRWTACGYSQIQGESYNETYTATAKSTSLRVFLCMLVNLNLKGRKTDVPKAFTKADLDTKIYVEQPEEKYLPGLLCSKRDQQGQPYVALLHKALEGLKQSGYLFQSLNTEVLTKTLKFTQLESEPTLFVKHTSQFLILILVWVDDYAIGYSSDEALKWFLQQDTVLKIRDEGELTKFVGLEITQRNGMLQFSQKSSIERAVNKFFPAASAIPTAKLPAIYDAKTRTSSLSECGPCLEGDETNKVNQTSSSYLGMVATALYFAVLSRPDIIYHAVYLARFATNPSSQCYDAVMTLLAYLYNTKDDTITYQKGPLIIPSSVKEANYAEQVQGNYGIYVTSDSSWKIAGSGLNMTYAGHLIFMNNAVVDWQAKLIKVICHSSTEAEIAAGCFAGKRAQLIRNLINELSEKGAGKALKGPLVYLIDNAACEQLTKNNGVSKRTEHFLRWQHYLRWLVLNSYAVVIWLSSKESSSDMCTKVLDSTTFLKHKARAMNKTAATD